VKSEIRDIKPLKKRTDINELLVEGRTLKRSEISKWSDNLNDEIIKKNTINIQKKILFAMSGCRNIKKRCRK